MNSIRFGLGLGVVAMLGLVTGCSSDASPATPSAGGSSAGGSSAGGSSAGGSSAGGSSAGGSGSQCAAFTPCGGELTGTWNFERACASSSELQHIADASKICPAGTASATESLSGTATFDAQGVLKLDTTTAATLTLGVPTSCLKTGQDCAAIQASIAAQTGVTQASCSQVATGCSCTYSISVASKQEQTYVKNGTSIAVTDPTDGTVTNTDFCVQGTSLDLRDDTGTFELTR